jgi:hypothetical protein
MLTSTNQVTSLLRWICAGPGLHVPAITCANGFGNLCAFVVLALSAVRLGKAMFKDQSRLLVLVACLIVGCAAAEPVTIRGVDPKLAARYSFAHGTFACLSGAKTSRVTSSPRPFASSTTHPCPATKSTAVACDQEHSHRLLRLHLQAQRRARMAISTAAIGGMCRLC